MQPTPEAEVRREGDYKSGNLILSFTFSIQELHENIVLSRVHEELEIIEFNISSSTEEVKRYNTELLRFIRKSVSERKDRAFRAKGIVSKLGIPLIKNPDAPSIEPCTSLQQISL